MTSTLVGLAVATLLGAALIAGLFFAFSTFIMRGLGRLPPHEGVAAMQSINVTVMTPWVMGPFFGTGIVSLAMAWFALDAGEARTPLLVAAALYVIGCIGITGTQNVPLNNRLEAVEAASAEAATLWTHYVARWTLWNHLRTLNSFAAAALILWVLLQHAGTGR